MSIFQYIVDYKDFNVHNKRCSDEFVTLKKVEIF